MNNKNRNLTIMFIVVVVVAFYFLFLKQKEGLINIDESPGQTPDEIFFYANFMLDQRMDVSPEEKAIAKEFLVHYVGERKKEVEKLVPKFAYLDQKYTKMLNDFGFLTPPEKQTDATRQIRKDIERVLREKKEAAMRPKEPLGPLGPTNEMIRMIEMQMKDILMNEEKYRKEIEMNDMRMREKQMREIDEIKKISDPRERDMRERQLRESHMKEQAQMRETVEREIIQMSQEKYRKGIQMNEMRIIERQMRELDELKKISDPRERDTRERQLRESHMKEQAQFREIIEREMKQMREPPMPAPMPAMPAMPAMNDMEKREEMYMKEMQMRERDMIEMQMRERDDQLRKISNPKERQMRERELKERHTKEQVQFREIIERELKQMRVPAPMPAIPTPAPKWSQDQLSNWFKSVGCDNMNTIKNYGSDGWWHSQSEEVVKNDMKAWSQLPKNSWQNKACFTSSTPMPAMRAPVPINANPGDAISCIGYNPKGAGAIYRYDGNKAMRHYPNPSIASSWDPNWGSGANRKIDCTGFTLGPDIAKR